MELREPSQIAFELKGRITDHVGLENTLFKEYSARFSMSTLNLEASLKPQAGPITTW